MDSSRAMQFRRDTICKGQTVTIVYDAEFAKEYPHTYKLFNGKSGTVAEFFSELSIVGVRLPLQKITTLVDRQHLTATGC